MNTRLIVSVIGSALTLSPIGFAQQPQGKQTNAAQPKRDGDGVQEAIQFQRAKDRADARQEQLQRRHPSVSHSDADQPSKATTGGHRLSDPGPAPVKK